MATKKTATKTSSRAKLNVPAKKTSSSAGKKSTSAKRKTAAIVGSAAAVSAAATVKNLKGKNLLAVILSCIIGIAAGIAAFFVISSNDTFEIIGSEQVTVFIGDEYIDEGVKIIEFGKDLSDKATLDSNLVLINGKTAELGTFYVKYSADTVKYGKLFKIEKIRLINVVEISEGGE